MGTSLNSLIICCLSFGDIYLFLWVVNCISSLLLFLDGFLDILVILPAILLSIKSPVASAVFLIALFEAVFIASVVDYLALSRSLWLYLLVKLLPMFLTKDKNPYPFTYILSPWFNWISHFYNKCFI